MQSLRDKLYMPIYAGKRSAASPVKITIIGAGSVGMATAFSLLTKGIPTELVIVDLDVDKVEAEVGDLQNARQFLPKVAIYGGSNYKLSSNSNIAIICAGVERRDNENQLSHVQRSVDALKTVIPHLVENSPKCIIIVLIKPVDVLAYVSWRISGFPKNRVLGLGTLLDSSKFCNAISKKLGISADAVSGYLLGEQGEKAVPIWSSVTCAGLKLRTIYPEIGTSDDKEGYNKIPQELIENERAINKGKGANAWAIGLATSVICQALLSDANCVFPLSIHAKGLQGVDKDIFFSLPCIVNTNGVRGIMIQQLDDDEKEKLFVSAKKMEELLQSIEW
ncbi:L-lactate dehydrogenase B chain [Fasciola gigantica]|uniref:L-lactate dehydrogenase B chain n=1 Tax=Fasciola gigantica TaxID=46835 RepID=A0A504YQ13_FASGI|nr:L-lactate dehydrogenase B chain [Fasciola gigantica]